MGPSTRGPFLPVPVERGRGPWERGCRPFAASRSRGTKLPCRRANVALRQDKEKANIQKAQF